jgi:hypothetical protein
MSEQKVIARKHLEAHPYRKSELPEKLIVAKQLRQGDKVLIEI